MSEIKTNSKANIQPWGDKEKKIWLAEQNIKRSYLNDVVTRLELLKESFSLIQYGTLSYSSVNYPLYLLKSKNWDPQKHTILVTGGVHGYETSGVMGAISFLENEAEQYEQYFNLVVAPCVSPWGYETINRWNADAIDPNRSFYENSPAQESAALMAAIQSIESAIYCHIDLHETTDTDNSVFRPALAARDAIEQKNWSIPDGFYLVGDTENPQDDFQRAMIKAVEQVTHIAPADDSGKIIGEPITQHGVINYQTKKLGLCAGMSNAKFVTTTEVYPDSPKVTPDDCVKAQVASITGGLNYLLNSLRNH